MGTEDKTKSKGTLIDRLRYIKAKARLWKNRSLLLRVTGNRTLANTLGPFRAYGCFCGFGRAKGSPVDEIDR